MPYLVIPAPRGGIEFLTPDQLGEELLPDEKWISTNVFDGSEFMDVCQRTKKSYADVCNLADFKLFLTIRNIAHGPHLSAPPVNAGVVGETNAGRSTVTVDSWKKLIDALQPSYVMPLYESWGAEELPTKKRRAAAPKLEDWIEACKPTGNARVLTPNTVVNGGGSVVNANLNESPGTRLQLLGTATPQVLAVGDSLQGIALAMQANVEFVESNLPFVLARRGCALDLSVAPQEIPNRPFIIDIFDTKFKLNKDPLSTDLPSPTASRYTKGYIHHLLVSQEMNGKIFLALHNVMQLVHLFRWCRECKDPREKALVLGRLGALI